MREVLFRGKRLDSGEWVYGGYKHEKVGEYLTAVFIIEPLTDGVFENHRVNPETVGQYTGLTDKSGEKIFEGDILSVYQAKKENAIVEFEQRTSSICLKWIDTDKCNFLLDFYLKYGKIYSQRFEIIGNIHDNSELLKGGAE